MSQRLQVIIWLSILSTSIWLSQCASATTLVWPDGPNGRVYRIDVEKSLLEAETAPMVWQKLGSVQMSGIPADAFPPATRVTCLQSGNSRFRYLLVDCTQQVYRFDTQTRTLERLDKTYFRGYNCYSAKFLRRDTLYSFGGYGFWHTNNIQTYYKAANHEWESLNPSTDAPHAIHSGFNGYLTGNDTFFSAMSLYQNDSENKGTFTWTDSVYAYSFRQKTWQRLGKLTTRFKQQIRDDMMQKASWFQVGNYFVLKYYDSPRTVLLIVDPIRNEVRSWTDTHKILANLSAESENGLPRSYVWKNSLYFRRDVSGITVKTVEPIIFSVTDLWKKGTKIGALYEPISTHTAWWIYGLAGIFILAGTGITLRYRKPNKRTTETIDNPSLVFDAPYPDSLNDQERDVFSALLNTTDADGLNVDQLNDILAIGDKSPDNQRKIRADVIKVLNLKLNLQWGIAEAIERVPTTLDRRMFTYTFNSALKDRVQTNASSQENSKLTS